ncbi:S41 family peptidase [Microbacter margulisiae]|uniref:Carboxyl-terminal processing protease n=1 Tax=Microbacter margulisiae TaxID=1350067 RepID=A0A7W5DRU6_9PORP|nr:S41 family peptidase [Microbacter margulisiae]MBB3187934.1 carboxyl-terminal processing protease [Microbacter margulisiae]
MKHYLLSVAFLLSCFTAIQAQSQFSLNPSSAKFVYTLNAINALYVTKVNDDKLVSSAIVGMLNDLDPHSVYIPKDEVERMNEPLEGSFDGVGIQFQMLEDTLYVVQTISGCPAAKVGILPGDRIIYIQDTLVAGVKMQNSDIMRRLRGPRGSIVNVKVLRRGVPSLIDFSITRDKIPLYSVDASYMLDPQTGYIKINSFGATTFKEFMEAFNKLKTEGMKDLVIDLQGNGGGYLNAAIDLANEFLQKGNEIVHTQGVHQPRTNYYATGSGDFQTGKLIVLIDEYTASASEIFTGAMQDWDRALVVGRRSFGKGLVQRPVILPDGSMLRLTTAHYYTPSGRCIQKPYKDGFVKYDEDIMLRYKRGEFEHADSIHFADSLKYKTLRLGRTVYGGGGIMPDIFVPLDTITFTNYLRDIIAKGIVNKVIMQYIDQNRKTLSKEYATFKSFNEHYSIPDTVFKQIIQSATDQKITFNAKQYGLSKSLLKTQLKALIANDLWGRTDYYRIMNSDNEIVRKAVSILETPGAYTHLIDVKDRY